MESLMLLVFYSSLLVCIFCFMPRNYHFKLGNYYFKP